MADCFYISESFVNPLFGNGELGVATLSSETWNAPTEDITVIEKQYKSLIIPQNAIVQAGNRNAGIIIRVQKDCIIEGSLINNLAPYRKDSLDVSSYYPTWMVNNAFAGNGSAGGGGSASGQTGRYYGGGYGGGGNGGYGQTKTAKTTPGAYNYHTGSGGRGGSFTTSDVVSVGGGAYWKGSYGDPKCASGGDGSGIGGGGGGAAANGSASLGYWGQGGVGGGLPNVAGSNGSSGYGTSSQSAGSGGGGGGGAGGAGGGVIIIYCGGNLTVTGTINCNGGNGGNGGSGSAQENYGSAGSGQKGGGGGGGRIYLLHMYDGTFTNGTFTVNAGTGANTGSVGNKYHQTYDNYAIGATPIAL